MLTVILLPSVTACVTAAEERRPRLECSLNGQWQTAETDSIEFPPRQAQWSVSTVPGTFPGVTGVKRWLRKQIDVPSEWRDRRLVVRYDGVRWNSRHFVNGRFVGHHVEGFNRFEIDITEAVRFGQKNELLVGVCDWQGVFDKPVDLKGRTSWEEARAAPRHVVLSPIGGHYAEFGIWADASLLAMPPVRVDDLKITTSVRENRLSVVVDLINNGPGDVMTTISGTIIESADVRFPSRSVPIAAGKNATIELAAPWSSPKLWTHETPNLYHLRIDLCIDGRVADRIEQRFGFREFWCEGPWFYLNGTRLTLRASSMWPLTANTVAEASGILRRLKSLHVMCFRTHTQPWRQLWYDAADEVGVLMIPEAPVWNDDHAYRLDDDCFWGHYAAEIQGMIRRLRNNPSVVAWSLENEFWGPQINDETPKRKARLAELGKKAKQWDSSRPITYESDGDPDGTADIVGIHYPHELPDAYLYPNTCYWMDRPLKTPQWFTNGAPTWKWCRTKPLYIGEYLWCPSPTPAGYSVVYGDQAYEDYDHYRRLAIGKVWSMQTRAYRCFRVSGLCPWTCADGSLDTRQDPMAAAQAESMRPLAAYLKEYNTRFYGDRPVRRTLHIINDTLIAGRVTVAWRLVVADRTSSKGEIALDMNPADLAIRMFEFTPPAVQQRTEAVLTIQAKLSGTPDFDETIPCSIFPPPSLDSPEHRKVGLLGFDGSTLERLHRAGLKGSTLSDAAAIPPDIGILIAAPNSLNTTRSKEMIAQPILRIAAITPAEQSLDGFLARGGRMLVLAQHEDHAEIGAVRFLSRQSTMTFALSPSHALLRDVQPDDLRFWGPDHVVADAHVDRTACGGQPVVVSGTSKGVDLAALAVCPTNKGLVIACGLRLINAIEDEPTAGIILRNALTFMDTWQPIQDRPIVLADEMQGLLSSVIQRAGFNIRRMVEPQDASASPVHGLIAGTCDDQTVTALMRRLEHQGGLLWWHSPSPDTFERVMKRYDRPYRLVPSNGPVVLRRNHPLVDGLAQADLYWTATPTRRLADYEMLPIDTSIIDNEVAIPGQVEPARVQFIPCETFQAIGSTMNRPMNGGFAFATEGSIVKEIDFAAGGPTIIGFRASGTPAESIWPRVSIRLDDRLLAYVSVANSHIETYARIFPVPAGRHKVTLSFLNDYYANGQDRNVWVKDVCIQPAGDVFKGLDLHAAPAALASMPIGKGRLVIDTVRWDQPEPTNLAAAERFAHGVLLKLGARATRYPIASVEAEVMYTGGAPLIKPAGGTLAFGTEGAACIAIACERPGRYVLRVIACGTKAAHEWPLMGVRLNGKEMGKIRVDSAATRAFDVALDLNRQAYTLEVAFLNDYYRGPSEDRNLYLDRIEIWTAE